MFLDPDFSHQVLLEDHEVLLLVYFLSVFVRLLLFSAIRESGCFSCRAVSAFFLAFESVCVAFVSVVLLGRSLE